MPLEWTSDIRPCFAVPQAISDCPGAQMLDLQLPPVPKLVQTIAQRAREGFAVLVLLGEWTAERETSGMI